MGLRRTEHAVYDVKYHLVWVPKYRAHVLDVEVGEYLKEVFIQIAEQYEFWIDTMEVMEDHVHVFAVPTGSDVEEHLCSGGAEEVPESKEADVVWKDMERRLLCQECGRRSDR